MKKLTAIELADWAYSENCPIDWDWIRHIQRTYSSRELMDWARNNVMIVASKDTSKQLIGRAAHILLTYL